MKLPSYETTVERDGEDVPVVVHYELVRDERGSGFEICRSSVPLTNDEMWWMELEIADALT